MNSSGKERKRKEELRMVEGGKTEQQSRGQKGQTNKVNHGKPKKLRAYFIPTMAEICTSPGASITIPFIPLF